MNLVESLFSVMHHAVALGRRDEERTFFMTRHSMCASLYKSNERYIERYNNMDIVMLAGTGTLENVVVIVTEVEFVPLYENQPLFGQVNEFLSQSEFAFHKFLNPSSRALKPFVCGKNSNYATQHLWADAAFVRNLLKLDACTSTATQICDPDGTLRQTGYVRLLSERAQQARTVRTLSPASIGDGGMMITQWGREPRIVRLLQYGCRQ